MTYESIESLMGISAPWIVHDIDINRAYNRVEVRVGMAKSGWFGGRRAVQNFAGHHKVWRHLNLGDMRCTVRVDYPEDGELPNAPWCGDAKVPFSNALGRQIISMLSEGISLGNIARVLNLDVDVLWQFKHGLDTGKLGLAQEDVPPRKPFTKEQTSPPDQSDQLVLPPATADIWTELLSGALELDMRHLGLRLLLMRLRQQYSMAQNDEVRRMKVQQLRHYFEKNESAAGHEIQQILEVAQ